VAVLVVDARGYDRDTRARHLQKRHGRRGRRSVVADLEDLHRRQEAAAEQDLLDRRLGVPGE